MRVSAAFFLSSPLNISYLFFLPAVCFRPLLPVVCSVAAVCLLLCPRGLSCLLCVRPGCLAVCPLSSSPFVPIGRAPEAPRRPSVRRAVCVCCRYSSIVRRKMLWQCGQMHRVYVPGLLPSCPSCAAVPCAVASCRPSVCVSCCLLSSGGNNSLYASISRAAAIRCSVCNVILLLSIWIYTFCRVCPRRFASSTMPTPTAAMCSRM